MSTFNYLVNHVMPTVRPDAWKILILVAHRSKVLFSEMKELTGISSDGTVTNSCKELVNKGLIATQNNNMTPQDAVELITAKKPQYIESGGITCSWCGGKTLRLQLHHYPISARDGGQRTVEICANCHDEYHYLTDNTYYVLSEAVLESVANE